MSRKKSEFDSIRCNLIFYLLIFAIIMDVTTCCGPGRSGGRSRKPGKLKPLVFKQHVPNIAEKTLGASGPIDGPITKSDPRFKDLVPNYNADIIFKDEEGSGEDRLMTQRCKEKLNTLAVSVMNLWPGIRLRVTESWDDEKSHHVDSLHYEGRAVDITTSDRDNSKYGMLARLAVEAGFDWVYYESRSHVHCSVKSESFKDGRPHSSCFSGDMNVTLENGTQKHMSDLLIGDRVLTLDSQGDLVYSPVLLFMHHSPEERTLFIQIEMTCGINLTITPSHLILRWQKSNVTSLSEAMPVYAKDVKEGEMLLISNHSPLSRPLFVDRVKNIRLVYETGVYAPLTETGTIVVNDVVASCYAVTFSQSLAHAVFLPVRLYYNIEASFNHFYNLVKTQIVTESHNTTSVAARYTPQNGIHWYCTFLQGLANLILPSSWMVE